MRANYLLKNRPRKNYFKPVAILVLIFVVGSIFFYFAEGVVVKIISPLWKAENFISESLGNKFLFIRSKQFLVEENSRLDERIRSLEFELSLLKQSGAQPLASPNALTASVLSRPPQTPYDIIIVDAGLDKGLSVGGKALLLEGNPIGTVFEVFDRQSKIKLYSTVGEETNAVLERNNVPVVLVGSGGGNFKIIVPRDMAVEKGDKILSLDQDPSLVAIVEDINTRPTDSFKEVLATAPSNVFSLRYIMIIK